MLWAEGAQHWELVDCNPLPLPCSTCCLCGSTAIKKLCKALACFSCMLFSAPHSSTAGGLAPRSRVFPCHASWMWKSSPKSSLWQEMFLTHATYSICPVLEAVLTKSKHLCQCRDGLHTSARLQLSASAVLLWCLQGFVCLGKPPCSMSVFSHVGKGNNICLPTLLGCWESAMNVCTVLQT